MTDAVDCTSLEKELLGLVGEIRDADSDQSWHDVEVSAHLLANALRVRGGPVDNHTVLGQTPLPQTLASLLKLALHGSVIPDVAYTSAVFELLRVAANLCMDHDENRAHLLEAGVPQVILSLLEGYAESLPARSDQEVLPLTIPHLKVVRTAIGVLLNASIGFDAVKFRLISLEAAMTIMKLSVAIYPPGSWSSAPSVSESIAESWSLRTGLSDWAWRIISELKQVKDETLQIFGPDVLPLLMPPLVAFCPPYSPAPSAFPPDSTLFNTLLHADFEALEESCMFIESLSLDVENVRLSLARGLNFPAEHAGVPCLSAMLDFIENGDYPPHWRTAFTEAEMKRKERAFDICKAAVIKAVVEVAGEERNEDVLWDDSEEGKPGGEFVCRMVEWIKGYVASMERASSDNPARTAVGRDDLVICASLSLGNLARRSGNGAALLSPPHSLAPILTSIHLLSHSADIKLKHGVIGLLKHLAQSSLQSHIINVALREAGVVERISKSGVWDEKADVMTEVVQVGAIGVVKHLCNADVEHTFALVLPSTDQVPPPPTGLSQILALVTRSDSVAVKSEGTRVLVNVVRSLWSSDATVSPDSPTSSSIVNGVDGTLLERQRKRQSSVGRVLSSECASALANLVGRSGKYPLLVNEGVVALSLLSTQRAGGSLVLDAILAPLLFDAIPTAESTSASASTSSEVSSPVLATSSTRGHLPIPRRAIDMLVSVLKNVDNPANFPIEVRTNVCSLFLQVGRHTSGEDLNKVKEIVRPTLEKVFEASQDVRGKEEMLARAAKATLDAWA